MRLDKCNICKQSITDFDHQVVIGYGIPELQYSLCPACARPIIGFLERHKLLSFPEMGRKHQLGPNIDTRHRAP